MYKKYNFIIFFVFIAITAFAQDKKMYDSIRATCEGPIFTLCEKMPSFKNGISFYEDTLKKHLLTYYKLPKKGKIAFHLTIIRSGEVKSVTSVDDYNTESTLDVAKAIKELSSEWLPGTQNGFIVCSHRNLEIEFFDTVLRVKILDSR